jgi:hypothetical protein
MLHDSCWVIAQFIVIGRCLYRGCHSSVLSELSVRSRDYDALVLMQLALAQAVTINNFSRRGRLNANVGIVLGMGAWCSLAC